MSSNLYDSKTGAVTHILDKDNLYTRFEYDHAGRITATYKETLNGEKQISKTDYHFKQ